MLWAVSDPRPDTTFTVRTELQVDGQAGGRTGVLSTPHGPLDTPAFTPVGTLASVKGLTPRHIAEVGSQAVLANAYHLYLQPGAQIVDDAGGVGAFMGWAGPTFTDSGGFQVMSLASRAAKVIDMEGDAPQGAGTRNSRVKIDDDGVTFRSHRDGSAHRFTPEISIGVQHQLGADVMFAFDELTTLYDDKAYQEAAVERTHAWAWRCLAEHAKQTRTRVDKPLQSLWGVIQGAQFRDLRRQATRGLLELSRRGQDELGRGFGGVGIGGAIQKRTLGQIVGWCCEELPQSMPRHLLGISEPDDIFAGVENGADTFDCVAPTRIARHAQIFTRDGRVRLINARFRTDHRPLDLESACDVAHTFTRAYLHHLFKSGEMLGMTIATMVNVAFINQLMADIRGAIDAGDYPAFKDEFLGRYYAGTLAK